MSINLLVLQKQEGRTDLARHVVTVAADHVMTNDEDVVIQTFTGHTISLPPNPIPGIVCMVVCDGAPTTVSGNGNDISGNASVALADGQSLLCTWDKDNLSIPAPQWSAQILSGVASGGGGTVLVSPTTQGLVEYDELGDPSVGNFTKTFTDQWAVETTDATITTLINPDAAHAALFDINGIVLDPGITTEVVAEINGDQAGTGNGAGYKIMMAWKRNGAGAPIAMFAAQLNAVVYGTNAGAPPATWAAGLTGNVPQLALVGPIGGKYYCQPQVQGVAAASIGWGGLFQWRKTGGT
jgi:hypothetical protein